jgi:cell division protein FtsX
MYFCVVLCIVCFVTFFVLFVCICVLNNCHRVATQLQLNISYHIKILSRRSRDQYNPSVTLRTEAADKQKFLLTSVRISLVSAPSTHGRYVALLKYQLPELVLLYYSL